MLYIPGTHSKGSCFPTVIACILDLELKEVPYFNLFYWTQEEKDIMTSVYNNRYLNGKPIGEAEDYQKSNFNHKISLVLNLWDLTLEIFLASKGYERKYIKNINEWLLENKDIPYMVSGLSPRGVLHVVIFKNGEMIHDPHPSGEGLVSLSEYPYDYLKKVI